VNGYKVFKFGADCAREVAHGELDEWAAANDVEARGASGERNWRRHLAAWRRCGLSQRVLPSNKLAPADFSYWKR